jgi:hypothetical protein
LIKIAADSAAQMIAFAGHFGLTPVARSRLAAGIGSHPLGGGKFTGLLGACPLSRERQKLILWPSKMIFELVI